MNRNETEGELAPDVQQNGLIIPFIVLAIILLLLLPINVSVIYCKFFRRKHTHFSRSTSRNLPMDGIYRTSNSSHGSNESTGLLELHVIEPAQSSQNHDGLEFKHSPLKRKDLSDGTEFGISAMKSHGSKIGKVDTTKVEVVNNYWGFKRKQQHQNHVKVKPKPRNRAKSFPPPRCSTVRRMPQSNFPVFNLAGEHLTDSLSPVSGVQYFDEIASSIDQRDTPPFATTLTTIGQATSPSGLIVPMNTPVNSKSTASSTQSGTNTQITDIDFGASAGVGKHMVVSSDSNMNVTMHTETDSSFVWDSFDPSYKSRRVSYANGAFVPVLRQTQFWV
ncbi:uncharacterized protein LOC117117351 [Anneissia japonica]|uniref:uncharacterized protein LOC117117351 n=1 Tax=Anneissia japonica TaxID=1529436 RepID=UPI0014259EDB|nr:uncharacterized protein LOC117117351 [Anneissia japonica]